MGTAPQTPEVKRDMIFQAGVSCELNLCLRRGPSETSALSTTFSLDGTVDGDLCALQRELGTLSSRCRSVCAGSSLSTRFTAEKTTCSPAAALPRQGKGRVQGMLPLLR